MSVGRRRRRRRRRPRVNYTYTLSERRDNVSARARASSPKRLGKWRAHGKKAADVSRAREERERVYTGDACASAN